MRSSHNVAWERRSCGDRKAEAEEKAGDILTTEGNAGSGVQRLLDIMAPHIKNEKTRPPGKSRHENVNRNGGRLDRLAKARPGGN
jgi:hypothetical protein